MLLGSEGILGVVTDAWVRVRPRPEWKAAATVRFERFGDACEAVREIVQAGLDPANCRLLEAAEAELTGAGDGSAHLLLLAFESAHHPVDAPLRLALEAAERPRRRRRRAPHHGAREPATGRNASCRPTNRGGGAAESWRGAFLLAPYLRDTFVACGVLSETFETAITWDRLEEFHATVMETTRRAVAEVSGAPREGRGAPLVTCRFTHAYPDGVAPYFTVLAPGDPRRRGRAVGRDQGRRLRGADRGRRHDHPPPRGRPRPPPLVRPPAPGALRRRSARRQGASSIRPAILNPGVLLDP